MNYDETELEIARTNRDRFLYAHTRGHEDFVAKAIQCDDFFFSKQWKEDVKAGLEKVGRPALTINKIKPIIKDMTGEYLTNRAEVKFVPSGGGEAATADALNAIYLHIANEQDFDGKELTLWLDGIISSRAYYDVRIQFDDNDQGEVELEVLNPKNVIPDPDADDKDPDTWNDVTRIGHYTIQDIERDYGPEKAKELKDFPNEFEDYDVTHYNESDTFAGPDFAESSKGDGNGDPKNQRLYFVVDRQYKCMEEVSVLVNEETGDVRRIPQSWKSAQIKEALQDENIIRETRRIQVIKWTVSCGTILLHDSISPYDKFTIIPFFPIFRRGKTAGGVEDLIDPQNNFNKQRSQELHIVNGTSNSGWKVKRGSLTNMTTEELEVNGAKTGLVIEYDGDEPKAIERIQPVSIPQGLDRASEKADRDLKVVSGIDDEARGVARAQTPGKAIQARREAALVSMTMYFESLAWTRKKLANRVLALVQKYYTEHRHFRITRSNVRDNTVDVEVNVPQEDNTFLNDLTLGEYDVVVTPTPVRDTQEQEQFEQLRQLAELGWSIPVHLMVESMHLSRKPEVVQELLAANGMGEPSEEEKRLQQMERDLKMAEQEANIENRRAQAALSQARAKKVLAEIDRMDLDELTKAEEQLLKARGIDVTERHNADSTAIRHRAIDVDAAKAGLSDITKNREIDAKLLERRMQEQPTAGEDEDATD